MSDASTSVDPNKTERGFYHLGYYYSSKGLAKKNRKDCNYRRNGCRATLTVKENGEIKLGLHPHTCSANLEKRVVFGKIRESLSNKYTQKAKSKSVVKKVLREHPDVPMRRDSTLRNARRHKEKLKVPIPLPRHKKNDTLKTVGKQLEDVGRFIPYKDGTGKDRKLETIFVQGTKERQGNILVTFDPDFVEEALSGEAIDCEYVRGDATYDKKMGVKDNYQHFTIMGKKKGWTYPLFWIEMSNKHESTYDLMWDTLTTRFPNFKPKKFMSDNEKALQNSVRRKFPGIDLRACLFHYDKALWKHAVGHGIADKNNKRDNPEAHKQIRKLMAVPRLPPEFYRKGFDLVKHETQGMFGEKFDSYFGYIVRTWHKEESAETVCVFDLEDPTNNDLERHHSQLPDDLDDHASPKNHFRGLIELSMDNWYTLHQIKKGREHEPRRSPEQREKLDRINAAKLKFLQAAEKSDEVIMEFIDECSKFVGEEDVSYVPNYLAHSFVTKKEFQRKNMKVQLVDLRKRKGAIYKKVSGEDVHRAPIVCVPSDAHFDFGTGEFSCSIDVNRRLNEKISRNFLDLCDATASDAEETGSSAHSDSGSWSSCIADADDWSESE